MTSRGCRTLPPAAPGVSEQYTTNSTNVTYYLNTTRSNFTYAENMCMRNGGHLASFTSAAEQLEVEEYYRDMGFLFPSYHVFYWSGLVVRGARLRRRAPAVWRCMRGSCASASRFFCLTAQLVPTPAGQHQLGHVALFLLDGHHGAEAPASHLHKLGHWRARFGRRLRRRQLQPCAGGWQLGLGGRQLQHDLHLHVQDYAWAAEAGDTVATPGCRNPSSSAACMRCHHAKAEGHALVPLSQRPRKSASPTPPTTTPTCSTRTC